MKCHEFISAAESLSLSQLPLMQSEDSAIAAHANECPACGEWLGSQRVLGAALQSLRMEAAGREGGPDVESALLRAFREHDFAPLLAPTPEHAAPAAWRLSRVFEFGAYAAVAAALMVGGFLGSRVLGGRRGTPAEARVPMIGTAARNASVESKSGLTAAAPEVAPVEIAKAAPHRGSSGYTVVRVQRSQPSAEPVMKPVDNDDFVALMLCDPLICSGDEQVIRMELPVSGGSAPVLADVVVGDDGLVRAMRIVN